MYLSRALELTPTDALRERFDLLLARERVFDVQADRVSQQQDLAELEALAALLNDAAAQAEVALRKARCLEYLGDFGQAFASVDQGLRVAPLGALEAVALKIMGAGQATALWAVRASAKWSWLPSVDHWRSPSRRNRKHRSGHRPCLPVIQRHPQRFPPKATLCKSRSRIPRRTGRGGVDIATSQAT